MIDNAGDMLEKLGYMDQFKEDGNPFPTPVPYIDESNEAGLKKSMKEILQDEFKSFIKTAPKFGFFEPMGCVPGNLIVNYMKYHAKIINKDKEPVEDRLFMYMDRHARSATSVDETKFNKHFESARKNMAEKIK